jgi:hypothetical protein
MKTNKNILFGLLILFCSVSLLLSSCEKEVEGEFDLNLGTITVSVPPLGPPYNEYKTFVSELVTTGIKTALNKNGASLDDIQSIKLKALSIAVTAPAGATFDEVLFMEAYLLSPGNDSTKLAFTEGDLNGLSFVDFSSNFSDVSQHVKNDAVTLLIRGFIENAIPVTSTLDVDFTVTIKIKKKK